MWPNPQKTADLVKYTEEFLNGKLHFLSGGYIHKYAKYSVSRWDDNYM